VNCNGDVGEEVERLIFGAIVRSNMGLSALCIEDRVGVTYNVDPKEFREYFRGRPTPKFSSQDWDVTSFPVIWKDASLVQIGEFNGAHGFPNYDQVSGRCIDPE
jgi:hypothetical protein